MINMLYARDQLALTHTLVAEAEAGYCLLSMAPRRVPDELPPGWWHWTSGNDVRHAVEPDGRCATCGRRHERPIDEQMTYLYDAQRTAEADGVATYGQDAIDAGGWLEIALAVLDLAPPWITAAAKAEYKRTNGIDVQFGRLQ